MEKHNLQLVRNNGVLRLPPGFRFHPTDEELVVQYLKRKVQSSCPFPASIIPELDVCKYNPWDLPGDREHEKYFFSTKEAKYPKGNRSNRTTGSGYWRATGPDERIVSSNKQSHGNVVVVGMKRTLVFYRGKPAKGSRTTDWVMHEYRLAASPESNTADEVAQESWVLCRVFLRTSNKNKNNKKRGGDDVLYDFMGKKGDLNRLENPSSSDASSGITTTDDYHELSSSANSFYHNF